MAIMIKLLFSFTLVAAINLPYRTTGAQDMVRKVVKRLTKVSKLILHAALICIT